VDVGMHRVADVGWRERYAWPGDGHLAAVDRA
jgi:hypothetical protein